MPQERSCLYINMNSFRLKGVLKSKKLALLVTSAAIVGILGTTKVYAAPTVDRYGGINRYETSAKVCDAGWNSDNSYAVLVNGENYPDALSAAPLAKKYNAPILLTGTEALSPYTSSELTRLNVKNVFIVGGNGVVSQSIEDGLKSRGIKVTRISGKDRYDTSIQVAGKLNKSDEVALVNGNDYKDGMTIASIAALKGMPVILTDGGYMPASVKKYLGKGSKFKQIYVIGDQNTISDSVISGLSNVKRVGTGGNAYSENVSIIDAFQDEINTSTLYIASARSFADSLSASAIAPQTSSPVLFVDSPMDEATSNFLKTHIVNNLKVLGGTGSISYDMENAAKSLPLQVGTTDNITDSIWQGEKYTPRSTMVVTATDGTKKEAAVDWNLTKIDTTKPGIYTFTGKLEGTDKTVYTTLTVKPIPYKIADLSETAESRASYPVPTTVSAQMTDGTTAQVPVTWDYGTQTGNKPGVYVFYGTVDKYSKKVKLTLTVTDNGNTTKTIVKINNLKEHTDNKSKYKFPTTVPAIMSDGSTQNVAVTWGNEQKYPGFTGVYTYDGTVSGYSGKVSLMLIVKDEGGTDPNDPKYPDNPTDNGTTIPLGSIDVIQGDNSYNLPTTVINPTTKKSEKIDSWTTTSIDNTGVDSDDYDECNISVIKFEGTVSGSSDKVSITVNVKPQIVSIYDDDLHITIKKSDGEYKLPSTIRVNVANSTQPKKIKIQSWDKPIINLGTPQTYYIKGSIDPKYYSNPVMITLRVQN